MSSSISNDPDLPKVASNIDIEKSESDNIVGEVGEFIITEVAGVANEIVGEILYSSDASEGSEDVSEQLSPGCLIGYYVKNLLSNIRKKFDHYKKNKQKPKISIVFFEIIEDLMIAVVSDSVAEVEFNEWAISIDKEIVKIIDSTSNKEPSDSDNNSNVGLLLSYFDKIEEIIMSICEITAGIFFERFGGKKGGGKYPRSKITLHFLKQFVLNNILVNLDKHRLAVKEGSRIIYPRNEMQVIYLVTIDGKEMLNLFSLSVVRRLNVILERISSSYNKI